MIYAVIMLLVGCSLIALFYDHPAGVPLFLLALIVMACAFALDITTPLSISL